MANTDIFYFINPSTEEWTRKQKTYQHKYPDSLDPFPPDYDYAYTRLI